MSAITTRSRWSAMRYKVLQARERGAPIELDGGAASDAVISPDGGQVAVATTRGRVESIRLLRVARSSAVKSRSAALLQVRDLIITAPHEIRDQLSSRKTLRGKVTVCARFRGRTF